MKFKSGILVNLIIITIFAGNYYLITSMKDSFGMIEYFELYLGAIIAVQAAIIILVIDYFLNAPIKDLEYKMKAFLGGRYKDKNIDFGKSLNPSVDFIMGSVDVVLNSLRGIKGELSSGRAIKSEVDLTKEIQSKLLNKNIKGTPSLDILARSKPAGEIGGDSYDVIKQENNYYIYVGDVTGHGVASGFVMVMVNALISGFSKIFKKGNQILAYSNEILKPRIKSNMLMSLLMVRWDEENKRMFMTGAGHEYLLVYKSKQKKCYKIKSGGLALGMTKNIHKLIKEQEVMFEQDDIIVLYTDGITEAKRKDTDGEWEMYGESALVNSIEKAPEINVGNRTTKTAKSVFNNITIELSKFLGYKHTQHDDITLTVIHYKGEGEIQDNLPEPENIEDTFITEWSWK